LYLFITSCSKSTTVDTIYYNGKIFTATQEQNFVEAMAVKAGNIVAVGNNEALFRKYTPADTTGIDLQGRLVLPGFHDAHLHFWNGAILQRQIDLRGLTSLEAVLEKVKKAVEQTSPGSWIIGRGWDHELWESRQLPDRYALDRLSRHHLIYLKRVDGHAAWVNTAVLDIIHYGVKTQDPPGGKIMRFPNSRELTGILFDTAYDIIDNIIPEPTFTQKYEIVQDALQHANSYGITSITDNSPADLYGVYVEFFKKNQLSVRVNLFVDYNNKLDSLKNYFASLNASPKFLKAGLVKLYADGSLGSRTAYLQEPYEDDPDNTGLPQYPFNELFEMVRHSDEAGFQVGIHGIGDAGILEILKVYEALEKANPRRQRRWRIEHAQVMDSLGFQKFRQLGVIASMQPSHCITDLRWAEKRIGKRARFSYAWNSFLEKNISLAFGTDWPVEPLNPMVGLYAAISRQDTLGIPGGGWYPEEKISLEKAVIAYTAGSAYAAKNEGWCGTLQPGRVADFIILDRDIFNAAPEEILHAKVLETYLGGKRVYERENEN
jgi:predicted amidohydrolase YtcJ